MTSIVQYPYNNDSLNSIREWGFGTNWPTVYIIYNEKKAYVGETLNAFDRTKQHLREKEFKDFSTICLISNRSFNKSVILDLESFLIKYMNVEGSKKLTNNNAGIVDHNYFYKDAYSDEFKEIWDRLIALNIIKSSISNIENSELFKYSPYKALTTEQQDATYDIIRFLTGINNASKKTMITVDGGAGTGKTILAIYLIKLLKDISDKKKVWIEVEDSAKAHYLEKVSENLSNIKKIGFVVPMKQLRDTMKKIASSIDGLSTDMILSPEEVVKTKYDLLVVDEAHRLYKRKQLPGSQNNAKFDSINEKLMEKGITRSEKDYTQLDWIIQSSAMQVLFYDRFQSIRITDIDGERFENICRPHLYKKLELFSQMRCKGGNGYYEYVKKVLEGKNLSPKDYKLIDNYELKVVDSAKDLIELIREKNNVNNDSEMLNKLVSGPSCTKEKDFEIDGIKFAWAGSENYKNNYCSIGKRENVIYSIHKVQGFDLNYAGVIFGKEIIYDLEKQCVAVDQNEIQDNRIKNKDTSDQQMLRYILNIYLTLMTRGISGTYIYAEDPALREYLKTFFN